MNPFQNYALPLGLSPYQMGYEPRQIPALPIYSGNPTAGYMGIYGTQPAREETPVSPGVSSVMRGMQEGNAGEGGDGKGFSSTSPGTPGSGFDVPGKALGVVGLIAGAPGAGALGSMLGSRAANDYLAAMGLSRDISTLEALKSGLSFGLFGQSTQAQTDEIMGRALEQGLLDPDVIDFVNEKLAGPTVAAQYGAQVASGERSASGAFFDAINDLNTVGSLSEVLGAIDSAANSGSSESQGSAPEGFSAGDGSQDPGGGWARGGYVPGGSGGMDDDVPAIIDGKGPARLSSGEFVFDAATVAALGDGNNTAGARKLDGLRKAIRKKAYGHEKQPPQNYSVGDLVRLYDKGR
jgi:hypothetical protein